MKDCRCRQHFPEFGDDKRRVVSKNKWRINKRICKNNCSMYDGQRCKLGYINKTS